MQEFTIKQAAELAGTTGETLRHYDRIGLVKPCQRDKFSGYRYYSQQEIVQLKTIELLKMMDFSLTDIKELLQQKDLSCVIARLKQAEQSADQKIARLKYAKEKIKRARLDYEKKKNAAQGGEEDWFVKRIPKRVILLSENLERPSLENLWGYHSHFYEQLSEQQRPKFLFEDMAGTITVKGKTRLFAVCRSFPSLEGLTVLPEGDYLCANCTEENKDQVLQALLIRAKEAYGARPEFTVHSIVVTGILQWDYQIQLYLQ